MIFMKNKKIFFLKIFTQGNPLRGVGGCNFLQLFTSYRTVLELLKSSPIIYFLQILIEGGDIYADTGSKC